MYCQKKNLIHCITFTRMKFYYLMQRKDHNKTPFPKLKQYIYILTIL